MCCNSMRGMSDAFHQKPVDPNPPTFIKLVALDVSELSITRKDAPLKIVLSDYDRKDISAVVTLPNEDGIKDLLLTTFGHRYSLYLVLDGADAELGANLIEEHTGASKPYIVGEGDEGRITIEEIPEGLTNAKDE